MNNQDIRIAIKDTGLRNWQVAEAFGLHEGNFSRLLRKELTLDQKMKVHKAIEVAKEKLEVSKED